MTSSDNPVILAVDIGGTKIAFALTELSGDTAFAGHLPTPQTGTEDEWFDVVSEYLTRSIKDAGFDGQVGGAYFSTTGPSVFREGTLYFHPPNIDALKADGGVAYPKRLAAKLGLDFGFDNDGNTALAAEIHDPEGSAHGRTNVGSIIWSTGVGCAFHADGKFIYYEARSTNTWDDPAQSSVARNSFEIGHKVVESGPDAKRCGDGGLGHLEGQIGGGPAEERGELPADAHPRFMSDGLKYLPKAFAGEVGKFGITQLIVSGTLGKSLLKHKGYGDELGAAISALVPGEAVTIKPSNLNNASLRGAQLLGIEAFHKGTLQPSS